jgi:hypothetical protein
MGYLVSVCIVTYVYPHREKVTFTGEEEEEVKAKEGEEVLLFTWDAALTL